MSMSDFSGIDFKDNEFHMNTISRGKLSDTFLFSVSKTQEYSLDMVFLNSFLLSFSALSSFPSFLSFSPPYNIFSSSFMLSFSVLFKPPRRRQLPKARWNFCLQSVLHLVLLPLGLVQTKNSFQVAILPTWKSSMKHIFSTCQSFISNI
jgi:hypothetical protein